MLHLREEKILIKDILIAPVRSNLISVSKLIKSGIEVLFNEDTLKLRRNEKLLCIQKCSTNGVWRLKTKLYKGKYESQAKLILNNDYQEALQANELKEKSWTKYYHELLGHPNFKYLKFY